MRAPAGVRCNGGHNIEITNAIECLQMTLSILYCRHHRRGRQIPPYPLSIFIMKRPLDEERGDAHRAASPCDHQFSSFPWSCQRAKINVGLHSFCSRESLGSTCVPIKISPIKMESLGARKTEIKSTRKSIEGDLEIFKIIPFLFYKLKYFMRKICRSIHSYICISMYDTYKTFSSCSTWQR